MVEHTALEPTDVICGLACDTACFLVVAGEYLRDHHLPAEVNAFADSAPSHWAVENRRYWSLDVVFRHDDGQVRKDNAPTWPLRDAGR